MRWCGRAWDSPWCRCLRAPPGKLARLHPAIFYGWRRTTDPTIRGLIPPTPQVPNFYVLFSVIAVAAAIIWASRQGKPDSSTDAGRRPPVDAKPPHPMAWLGCSLFGIVFAISGIAMCFSPWTPTGGGKGGGLLLHLAYLLLGDYGPAILIMGMGAVCGYKAYTLLRDG